MTEGAPQQQTVYLKNKNGTVIAETNPDEIARLQKETSYQPISTEEGKATFANKTRMIEKLDRKFGGKLSEAIKANETRGKSQ